MSSVEYVTFDSGFRSLLSKTCSRSGILLGLKTIHLKWRLAPDTAGGYDRLTATDSSLEEVVKEVF